MHNKTADRQSKFNIFAKARSQPNAGEDFSISPLRGFMLQGHKQHNVGGVVAERPKRITLERYICCAERAAQTKFRQDITADRAVPIRFVPLLLGRL